MYRPQHVLLVMLQLVVASAAHAAPKTTPVAPVAASGLGGTAVPGLCFMSRGEIFNGSKMGKAAGKRLDAISKESTAEIEAMRRPVTAEFEAYRAQQGAMKPEARAARERELSDKAQPITALSNQRQAELEATRQKALEMVARQTQPILAVAYTKHGCGVLMDRDSAIGGNLSNDLTQEILTGLDAKDSTITLDRVVLPSVTG